jgi:hypothetical protein
MQCRPVPYRVDAKTQAALRPFEHTVIVRPTAFVRSDDAGSDKRAEFHALYSALIADEMRNRRICDDVVEAVRDGRSPLVLTERHDHLDRLVACPTFRARRQLTRRCIVATIDVK